MSTISHAQQRAQMEAIARKISQGLTDGEIIEDLRISRGTFYRYKFKAFAIYGNIATKKTQDVLEFEAEILKDRLVRLFRATEIVATDKNNDASARVAAAAVGSEIAINIFKLEAEGFKSRMQQDLRQLVAKSQIPNIRRIGDIPVELPAENSAVTSTESINSIQFNEPGTGDTQEKVY